jgi:hypothetical protein
MIGTIVKFLDGRTYIESGLEKLLQVLINTDNYLWINIY